VGSWGFSPGFTAGLALQLGVRRRELSLGGELRADLPTDTTVATTTGRVSASPFLLTAVPCYHVGPLALCALITAGLLRGEGAGFAANGASLTPFFALGARVALEAPIAGPLAFYAHLDARYVPTTTQLQVQVQADTRTAWQTEPVNLAAGLGVALHFP
jgi:hypothetical protein